jgi:hypothetical protein
VKALRNANRLQDILFEETSVGRTGNEILTSTLAKMKSEKLDGTMYSHPIGMHGHGAGPLIGLWDYQEGVPGRGDAKVISSMWYSSELQVTTPVPEWNNQPVRVAQEEDFIIDKDGSCAGHPPPDGVASGDVRISGSTPIYRVLGLIPITHRCAGDGAATEAYLKPGVR